MLKMKKYEAFAKMTKLCGPWNMWGRAEHIAYGLVRGVPYERMESSANDNPHAVMYIDVLWKVGAWSEHPAPEGNGFRSPPNVCYQEAITLVKWIKKTPRLKNVETGELAEELDSNPAVSRRGVDLGGEVA